MSVTSCTFNAGNAKADRVTRDLTTLARKFPVVCLQEVADRAANMNQTGAQVLTQDGQDRGHVAILVSSPAVTLSTGYIRCTRRSFVGAWGAGPSTLAAKWVLWALVDFGGGVVVTVADTHMVPSVQRKATGPAARLGLRRRRAIYRKHVAAIVQWAATVQGPVALHMDANATKTFDLLQPLVAAGFVCQTAPSHGDRPIDQVWLRDCTPEHVEALDGFSSDHRPVAATYTPEEAPPVPTTLPDPFERITFRGKTMDNKTAAALKIAERRLGYELTVTQGCYNPGGVSASAGTHDLGGVVDLAPFDWENKVRVLRDLGFAAWHRTPAEGKWVEHIHAVMVDHGNLSAGAAEQVVQYRVGQNGLANHAADTFDYRPDPIPVFDYRKAWRDDLLRERITGLKARIKTLRDRASAARQRITYK